MPGIQNKLLRKNLETLYFSLSEAQYLKLRRLKDEGFCKIMYILRYSAMYVVNNKDALRAYKDKDFNTRSGKRYKVDLPIELYKKMEDVATETGLSMSKIMRIGLNDVLSFL